jgi:hypothetical protein
MDFLEKDNKNEKKMVYVYGKATEYTVQNSSHEISGKTLFERNDYIIHFFRENKNKFSKGN